MNITRLRAEAASAIHAVRVALQVIAARTDGDRTITKGRLDIATGTDLKSQALIREVLERAQPEHLFVGEESGCDRAPAVGSYWLVDPICGTRNYASGLPLYCVNVALVEHGRVVVAAVGDGPSGQVWVAEQGRGAWVDEGGNLVRISASEKSATVLLDPAVLVARQRCEPRLSSRQPSAPAVGNYGHSEPASIWPIWRRGVSPAFGTSAEFHRCTSQPEPCLLRKPVHW